MAGSPIFKVYDADGAYQASCKEPEQAAAIIACVMGDGATIRYGHGRIVWREGEEDIPASESYDIVAETVWTRISDINLAAYERQIGLRREGNE